MEKRDSKDPMPTADNSQREGGGNMPYPGGSEGHGAGKAEHVKESQRYTLRGGGIDATSVRDGEAGQTPATGEMHNSKKAEKIPENRRY